MKGAQPVQLEVHRSVHGPIVHRDEDAGLAYAAKRAWDGRELETLLAWLHATWASDYGAWKAQAEKSAMNVNLYYADVWGNIGYFHGGHFPKRAAGHDNRLPVSGAGGHEWQGRQSMASANPNVLNPSTGYLVNWNNKPGQGVQNPDLFYYSWSAADRANVLVEAIEAHDEFTPQQAWALIETSSYADVFAHALLPLVDQAESTTDDDVLQAANALLQAWDGQSRDRDGDGYYDEPATAFFRTFVGKLAAIVLADDLGPVYALFSATGYPTAAEPTAAGTNLSAGVKAVVEALHGNGPYDLLNGEPPTGIVLRALAEAVAAFVGNGVGLENARLPVAKRPFAAKNFLDVPQAGPDAVFSLPIEQNRGTENNMVVLRPNAIEGWEVTPPGQSGFVSPNGRKSPHYADQLDLYQTFGRKRMWFYAQDVQANARPETVLSF